MTCDVIDRAARLCCPRRRTHRPQQEETRAMDRRHLMIAAAAAGSLPALAAGAPMALPAGAIAVTVTLHVAPEHEAEFLRLLTPVLDAMRQEASFVAATLHRDPEDPALFMLHEIWADRGDLVEVQMRRPYRAAYEARLPALLRTPREARAWQPLRADAAARP
jgi:quinol monooxygenase YgiN